VSVTSQVLVEAAVETLAGALRAERDGAGRLELCTDLPRGGTTPSAGLLRTVRRQVALPIHVMIRPHPGRFRYDVGELDAMAWDIAECRRAGADGVVFGVLSPSGSVAREATARLAERARPLAVTFHRAVDATENLEAAVETLVAIGIERVLTSGGASTAKQGLKMLSRLARRFGDRIGILPGGGVRATNVARLLKATRVAEVHVGFPEDAEPGRIADVCQALRNC
jgi:copper homeostasis protein